MPILEILDYAGVAVFAATGALSASRKQLDIIGYVFLASMTGIGGGTLRDVILGATPVFWVTNPVYLLVCTAVGLAVFFSAHRVESRYRAAGLAGCDRAFRLLRDGRGEGSCGNRIADGRHRYRHADGHLRRYSTRSPGRRTLGASAA